MNSITEMWIVGKIISMVPLTVYSAKTANSVYQNPTLESPDH